MPRGSLHASFCRGYDLVKCCSKPSLSWGDTQQMPDNIHVKETVEEGVEEGQVVS